jgi:hypothetical protein
MPSGWAWSDKGSAIFTEDDATSELFLLGYLNSALATYFMKKIVNTTATAHAGYIEKLPYRRPPAEIEATVVTNVERIVAALKEDPGADIGQFRAEIDAQVFDLFEIRDSRDEVLGFYDSIGRAVSDEPEEDVAQAAKE